MSIVQCMSHSFKPLGESAMFPSYYFPQELPGRKMSFFPTTLPPFPFLPQWDTINTPKMVGPSEERGRETFVPGKVKPTSGHFPSRGRRKNGGGEGKENVSLRLEWSCCCFSFSLRLPFDFTQRSPLTPSTKLTHSSH